MASKAKPVISDEQFQAIARALADPRRFAILQQIAASGCLACTALAEREIISASTISHHLRELSEAGLVQIAHTGRTAELTFRRPVWKAYRERLASL